MFSRRTFLQLSSVGLLTSALARSFSSASAQETMTEVSPTVFEAMRRRWRNMIVGQFDPRDPLFAPHLKVIASQAKKRQQTLDRSPNRESLWPQTRRGDSASVTDCYKGLYAMALAYATPGSGMTGDAALLADIIAGLDFMQGHYYNETTRERDNWWDWEIGSPQLLTDTCILVYDHLTPQQRAAYARSIDRFIPDPTLRTAQKNLPETGANRSDKCQNIAIRALLTDDAAKLKIARDGLSQIFKYVTSGDGYHEDGSFIQHNDIPYTGSYGVVLLSGLARLFAFFAGTPWQVTDEGRRIVFDAVERCYAPFIYDGLLMDAVCGRAITRESSRDQGRGNGVMSAILLLAEGVPPEYAATYRAHVKGWLLRGRKDEFLKSADIPSIRRVQAILRDDAILARPEPANHRLFPNSDRAVHRRPGWAFVVSMCSSRIARYESSIHGENKRGWYTSDGMTYLYLHDDHGHYTDDFWPTVNSYRLPGTTVDTHPREDNSGGGRPQTKWVGGACLNELYAAVGMELQAFDCTLRAKKSWFCLDDAIVCLGSGIASTDGRPIETIIENRNLRGDGNAIWQVNGRPILPGDGTVALSDVKWAHLEGISGYVFPNSVPLKAVREKRSDSWDAVGSLNPSPEIVSRRYLTFWLDHGTNPTNATYAYVVLPQASPQATARYAQKLPFEILANTEEVQAIRIAGSGLIMANFWTAGKIADIEVDGPCSLVLQQRGSVWDIAISDPSRTTTAVQVTLPAKADRVVRADSTISATRLVPRAILNVKTEKARGKPHSVRFSVGI